MSNRPTAKLAAQLDVSLLRDFVYPPAAAGPRNSVVCHALCCLLSLLGGLQGSPVV